MAFLRPRIERRAAGRYALRLPAEERELLRNLLPQLRDLLTMDDPDLQRLFPTAYPDDPERDREYQGLVHDELLESRLAAIDTVEETLDDAELDEEALQRWMGAINALRLVLGTKLDVSEDVPDLDPDDPEAPAFAVYEYLGFLLELSVRALVQDLPDPDD